MTEIRLDLPAYVDLLVPTSYATESHDLLADIDIEPIFLFFSGKGVSTAFANQVNLLSQITSHLPVQIATIDKSEPSLSLLSPSVLKLPSPRTDDLPLGLSSENFQLQDLEVGVQAAIKYNSKIFVKARKDMIIDIDRFLAFLISLDTLLHDYLYVVSELSTNAFRNTCISDIFFACTTKRAHSFLGIPFRTRSSPEQSINFLCRQEIILFDNFQPEQWLWSHALLADPEVSYPSTILSYYELINRFIYIISPQQSGLFLSRNEYVHLKNWHRFSPFHPEFFETTTPLTDFTGLNETNKSFFFRQINSIRLIRIYISLKQAIILAIRLVRLKLG